MPLPRHPFNTILKEIDNRFKEVSIKQFETGVTKVRIQDWEETL